MVPWLIIELLSQRKVSLSELVFERKRRFPSSGEINFKVSDTESCLRHVKEVCSLGATYIDELDGLSVSFEDWRFNLRKSNTEPLVRLNLETIGNKALLKEKVQELENVINQYVTKVGKQKKFN